MDDEITVEPIVADVAETNNFVLKESKTTRLVARAKLVQNSTIPEATVQATLFHERKSPKAEWEECDAIDLKTLKGGEGVRLSMDSETLFELYKTLCGLFALREQHEIPFRDTKFFGVRPKGVFGGKGSEIVWGSNAAPETTQTVVEAIVAAKPDVIEDIAAGADSQVLSRLKAAIGLSQLETARDSIADNLDESNEEWWQTFLSENAFVIQQALSFPVAIIGEKAYLGGKGIENRGGSLVDFLATNSITHDAVIIEIKPPTTALTGGRYRSSGAFPPSRELGGSIVQVLNYRRRLMNQLHQLKVHSSTEFQGFAPKCVVIAGNAAELKEEDQIASFELFRDLHDVELITYDELLATIDQLIATLSQTAE